MTIRNGRHIDRYIPRDLEDMFYRNPNPKAKYARHNGYDPYAIPTSGLVLYAPLWALKGDVLTTIDGYQHTGTVDGADWRYNGRTFGGSASKITIPSHASLNMTTALTLIAWVYHDLANSEFMIAKQIADIAYSLYTDGSDKLILRIDVSSAKKSVVSTNTVGAGAWKNCAGVYNKTDLRVYQNGELDCTPVAQTGDIDVTTDDVTIGWGIENTYGWDGTIGEVMIYNRALSAGEIAHIYNVTKWRYF